MSALRGGRARLNLLQHGRCAGSWKAPACFCCPSFHSVLHCEHGSHVGPGHFLSRKSPALVRQDENDEPSPPENLGERELTQTRQHRAFPGLQQDRLVLVSEVRLAFNRSWAVFLKPLTLGSCWGSSSDEAHPQIPRRDLCRPVTTDEKSPRHPPGCEQCSGSGPGGGRAVCKVLLAPLPPGLTPRLPGAMPAWEASRRVSASAACL